MVATIERKINIISIYERGNKCIVDICFEDDKHMLLTFRDLNEALEELNEKVYGDDMLDFRG